MSFADVNHALVPCFNHLHTYFTEHVNILLLLIAAYTYIRLDIVLFNMQVIGVAVALICTIQLLTCSCIVLV